MEGKQSVDLVQLESMGTASDMVMTSHESEAGKSQAPSEDKEQPTNHGAEAAKSKQQYVSSTTDSHELADAGVAVNDSSAFTV